MTFRSDEYTYPEPLTIRFPRAAENSSFPPLRHYSDVRFSSCMVPSSDRNRRQKFAMIARINAPDVSGRHQIIFRLRMSSNFPSCYYTGFLRNPRVIFPGGAESDSAGKDIAMKSTEQFQVWARPYASHKQSCTQQCQPNRPSCPEGYKIARRCHKLGPIAWFKENHENNRAIAIREAIFATKDRRLWSEQVDGVIAFLNGDIIP